MPQPLAIFGLTTLLLGVCVVFATADLRLPGNDQGYEPDQPIAFSHRLHSGELEIDCEYCHYGVRKSRHAGIPPANLCMNCHRLVSSSFDAVLEEEARALAEERDPQRVVSPELAILYAALGLDSELAPLPGAVPRPIEWVRVHSLPDFVYFDHRPHVAADVTCESCHGLVQGMERMRQAEALSMGWCLECHRESDGASTDCVTCHL